MARLRIKAATAAELIRTRILRGDHALTGLPSERVLAEEFGISRETLRKALRVLEDEGTLVRQPNGRLCEAPVPHLPDQKKLIGLVKHSNPSHDHQLWVEAVCDITEAHHCTLKIVTFEHYEDAAIPAALHGFDGLFFLPPAGEIPGWLISKICQESCRVVVLDQDATHSKLPSVVMFPPKAEQKLLEYLVSLGHRRIDCLNTQQRDSIIEGRISAWRTYLKEQKLTGQLHSLTEFRPVNSAYQLIKNRLLEGRSLGSALVCTTGPAAIGAIRACYEVGLKVGEDVSICAVNDEGLGPFLVPSLTSLQTPTRSLYLERAIKWMLGGDWNGPYLIQPEDVPMFIGDSTRSPDSQTKLHQVLRSTDH